MSRQEALETTVIHSVAGKTLDSGTLIINRPFRTPHHSISPVAMTGGGSRPQPGEISLAHNGVLYLDEFPEFKRNVLEVLRQPMEDRNITINRAQYSVKYPANVMLIASMNPCPCGHYNDPNQKCLCNPGEIKRYMNRISGPLLDRLDLQIECVPVPFERLREERQAENNQTVRERVIKARNVQQHRFGNYPGVFNNAMMSGHLLRKLAQPNQAGLKLLERAMKQLHYSARGYDRILKVSRTIADLAGAETIGAEHIAEAIQYRKLDRSGWGS
jgi:magnesium chelatase family protein